MQFPFITEPLWHQSFVHSKSVSAIWSQQHSLQMYLFHNHSYFSSIRSLKLVPILPVACVEYYSQQKFSLSMPVSVWPHVHARPMFRIFESRACLQAGSPWLWKAQCFSCRAPLEDVGCTLTSVDIESYTEISVYTACRLSLFTEEASAWVGYGKDRGHEHVPTQGCSSLAVQSDVCSQ